MAEDLIVNLKTALNSLSQKTLFGPDPEIKLREACVLYLRNKGYRVVDPTPVAKVIKNIDDLISYFYILLNRKYPDRHASSINLMKDRAIAKRFVEGRMEASNIGLVPALNECGEIVKTVIEREEEFNFKFPIDFPIFGGAKLKWVTDLALKLMNKELVHKEAAKVIELQNKATTITEEDSLGYDLDSILKSMGED